MFYLRCTIGIVREHVWMCVCVCVCVCVHTGVCIARVIQRAFHRYKVRELTKRLNAASLILKKYAWKARLNVYCRWRRDKAFQLREFLTTFTSQGKLLTVIKQFKWGVLRCQRVSREYLACRNARLVLLNRMWDQVRGAQGWTGGC